MNWASYLWFNSRLSPCSSSGEATWMLTGQTRRQPGVKSQASPGTHSYPWNKQKYKQKIFLKKTYLWFNSRLSPCSSSGEATWMLTGGCGRLTSSSSSANVGLTRTEVARLTRWQKFHQTIRFLKKSLVLNLILKTVSKRMSLFKGLEPL